MLSKHELVRADRDELINHILDLQAENAALSRELRAGSKSNTARQSTRLDSACLAAGTGGARHSHCDPASLSADASSPQSTSTPLSPMAARLSSRPTQRPAPSYTISMSVMVIENGSALAVPMSAVLDKSYGRPDIREADTPVVASSWMRSPESLSTQRFSIGSAYRGEPSPSMNLDEDFAAAEGHNRLTRPSMSGSGHLEGRSRGSVSLTGEVDEDEPSPQRPSLPTRHHARGHDDPPDSPPEDGAAATALARRAGVTRLNLQNGLLLQRDVSLDPDAIVSNETLLVFNRRFQRDCNVLSPLSSYGNAVYHYIVKVFAVRNGCQHLPDDVEGFGRTLISLCREVRLVLQGEPRHSLVHSPCYVFGDLHGNFRDLFYFMDNLISFQDLRYTPHRFVFLGDYVDRGEYSVEVLAYLFAMKVLAPDKVLLLRGNHEDTLVSGDISGYGKTSFRAQCHALFGPALGEEIWSRASDTFAYLPLTASIDRKIFCTHGGPPRYHGGVDDRMELLRSPEFPPLLSFFEAPPDESERHRMFRQIGMDTCWADPAENEGRLDRWGFGSNPRGTGVILFGTQAVDEFLDHFGYEFIFRAHQEKADGLKLSKSARVFTVFSTSAYVGHQNGAGVLLVADGKIRLIVKNADSFDDEEDEYDEEVQEN